MHKQTHAHSSRGQYRILCALFIANATDELILTKYMTNVHVLVLVVVAVVVITNRYGIQLSSPFCSVQEVIFMVISDLVLYFGMFRYHCPYSSRSLLSNFGLFQCIKWSVSVTIQFYFVFYHTDCFLSTKFHIKFTAFKQALTKLERTFGITIFKLVYHFKTILAR